MTAGYAVRLARPEELPALRPIERAAARLFAATAHAAVQDDEDTPVDDFVEALAADRLWVAADADDRPVGFAIVARVDGCAHLEELDVHPDHGRRGLGAALVDAVKRQAASSGLPAVTLTTFRDVPWNAPFYARQGFAPLAPDDWTPGLRAIVAAETARGLDPAARVVMRCPVSRPA